MFSIFKKKPSAEELYSDAQKLAAMGKSCEAIEEYSLLIQHYPNHGQSYLDRGGLYAVNDQTDLAINDFKKAIALDHYGYIANTLLGNVYLHKLSKEKEALEYYQKAIALEPQDSFPYFHFAQALLAMKQNELASAQLKNALKLSTDENLSTAIKQLLLVAAEKPG